MDGLKNRNKERKGEDRREIGKDDPPCPANERGVNMERRDRISSLVGLVLSAFVCVESYRLPMGIGNLHEPGPGFFPFAAGLFMGGLSLLVYLLSMRARKPDLGLWYVRESRQKLLLILAILFGYAFLLEPFGFILSTFLLLFLLFKWVEGKGWGWAIAGSLGGALISFGIFDKWLMMQLPKGMWGF
jgi:putative tricarboxylic transport membrane protein